jgi:hypothetical protein
MRAAVAVPVLALLTATASAAQDLEPRAYSPSPRGTTFFVVSATRSAGDVFTDPSAPITGVNASVGILGLAVGHVFALAGKQMQVLAALPVTWGTASGLVGEDRRAVSRRGLADPRVRLSMILAGSPPRAPSQFARAPRRPILGWSLTVAGPAGQYDPAKLINLGSNRWGFRPEIGASVPAGRWTLDAYAGVWFFTENRSYYPGSSRRRQDPVLTLQGHVSYALGRRAWVSMSGTWYRGGRTWIDDVGKADLQQNTRLGATLTLPVSARQSIKAFYSAGATTRIGADFRTISAAWQLVIF